MQKVTDIDPRIDIANRAVEPLQLMVDITIGIAASSTHLKRSDRVVSEAAAWRLSMPFGPAPSAKVRLYRRTPFPFGRQPGLEFTSGNTQRVVLRSERQSTKQPIRDLKCQVRRRNGKDVADRDLRESSPF